MWWVSNLCLITLSKSKRQVFFSPKARLRWFLGAGKRGVRPILAFIGKKACLCVCWAESAPREKAACCSAQWKLVCCAWWHVSRILESWRLLRANSSESKQVWKAQSPLLAQCENKGFTNSSKAPAPTPQKRRHPGVFQAWKITISHLFCIDCCLVFETGS